MVHKRLKFPIGWKSAEFAPAAVTAGNGRNPLVDQPVDRGKNRQAQAKGPRHKDDTDRHNGAAEGLIEILHDIELTASAARAAFKNA